MTRCSARRFALLALAVGLGPLGAAESTVKETVVFPRSAAGAPASVPAGDAAVSTQGLLFFAVMCAGGGGWLLWRRRAVGHGLAGEGRRLKIVETQSLGNRQFLVVADYDGSKVLLGVCPGQIRLLTHLGDSQEEGP
jgi:flagellar biogenesis protein FliO